MILVNAIELPESRGRVATSASQSETGNVTAYKQSPSARVTILRGKLQFCKLSVGVAFQKSLESAGCHFWQSKIMRTLNEFCVEKEIFNPPHAISSIVEFLSGFAFWNLNYILKTY